MKKNGKLNYPPNEFIFADYITKQKVETVRTEWVLWMLRMLHDARLQKKSFTKEFIKSHPETKKEPLMVPVTNTPASAPPQTSPGASPDRASSPCPES